MFSLSQLLPGDDTSAGGLDANDDADSDGGDVSAPVKRRRKMVLIDEDED